MDSPVAPSEADLDVAEVTDIEECPECGSLVIVRMDASQFRCFACDFIWEEALPSS